MRTVRTERDRMRPIGDLVSVDEALRRLGDALRPIDEVEEIPIEHAGGRVLAEEVVAAADVPAFTRAAMDGYAVRSADTVGSSREACNRMRCVEVLYAGNVPSRTLEAGECTEIATGAPVPPGADAVLKVEDTAREGDAVLAFAAVRAGQAMTRQGADIRAGETVLQRDVELNPSKVGALAAVGRRTVRVYRRPFVKVGSSGDEVVEPGQPLQHGQVYNINSYSLGSLLLAAGCRVELLPNLEDRGDAVEQSLRSALDADLIVFSGGSSVGIKDIMQDVAASMGEVLFHGVAIKPGKPTMLALIEGKPLLGMPGYPTSCLSNGYIFLLAALRRLSRRPLLDTRKVRLPLAADVRSEPHKLQVYTVRVEDGKAWPAFKESGLITSMSAADGYFVIEVEAERVPEGTLVDVTLF